MAKSIIHYKWSPRRSLIRVATISWMLVILPSILTPASISLQPVSRADLHQIIALNHPNPRLVKAVIQVESEWNPNAVSSKGAIGLMQVMPSSGLHFAGYSREDLFCPVKNINAGTRILKHYQKTSSSLEEALKKYSGNAKGYYNKVVGRM